MDSVPMIEGSPEPSFLPASNYGGRAAPAAVHQQKPGRPTVPKAASTSKLPTSSSSSFHVASAGAGPPKSSFPPLNSPPFSTSPTPLLPKDAGGFNINNVTINGDKSQGLVSSSSSPSLSSFASQNPNISPLKPASTGIRAFQQPDLSFTATPTSSAGGQNGHSSDNGALVRRAQSSDSATARSNGNGVAGKKALEPAAAPAVPFTTATATSAEQKAANPLATASFAPYAGPAYVFGAPFDMSRFPGFHPGLLPVYAPMKPNMAYVARGSGGSNGGGNVAEKRANHNAIERARRDSLNNRFQEIADSIPQLREVKKPSKSVIMHKTLEYVKASQKKLEQNGKEIAALKKENERLRQEAKIMKACLNKLSPADLESLGYFEAAQSPHPTTPPQEESGLVKDEVADAEDDYGQSYFAPEVDDGDTYSRESSVVSQSNAPYRPQLTVNLSQFDAPLFPEREHGVDSAMDYSDHNATLPAQFPGAGNQMIGQDLSNFPNNFQHHRGSFHSSAVPSLNSSALGSPESSYPGSEYLEDSFSFDSLREKVQHGLTIRHDQNWLTTKNILKKGPPGLHDSRRAMEFGLKKKTLKSHLSTRPSVEDLVGMNILQ